MHKHIRSTFTSLQKRCNQRNAQVCTLALLAVVGSFSLGIQSAGDLQPITLIQAGNAEHAGDIDGNGSVTIQDAIAILEVVQGYNTPTIEQLKADPNGDYVLTVDDAIRVLKHISLE